MTSSESPDTLTCQSCGALVDASLHQRHQDFHDQVLTKKEHEDQALRAATDLRSS